MEQELNFPKFSFNIKPSDKGLQIFCIVRKKWMVLTPEEWVRQHMLHYLNEIKDFPLSLMGVEKQLKVLGLKKRFDILCVSSSGSPLVLVECKAPNIELTGEAFDQAARYNRALFAPYLCISNGYRHFFCKVNEDGRFDWFQEIPDYPAISL